MTRLYNKKCIVPMCGNTSRECPDMIFFYVPRDTVLRRAWLEAVQVKDNFRPTSNLYCCEDHFNLKEDTEENKCYTRKEKKFAPILKIGIVPHIFNGQKNREDSKTTLNEKKENVSCLHLKTCIIPTCGNTAIKCPKKRFFSVPRHYDVRKNWLEAVQRIDLLPTHTLSFLYICEDHFDQPQDFQNYSRYITMEDGKKIKKSLNSHVAPQKFNSTNKKVSSSRSEESLGCLTKNKLIQTHSPSDPSTHNKCTTEGPGDPYREPSANGASSVAINVDPRDYVRTLDSIVNSGGPTKVVKNGVRDFSGKSTKIFDEISSNQKVSLSTELLARRYLQHVAADWGVTNLLRGEVSSLDALALSMGVANDRAFHSRLRDFHGDLFRIIQRRVVSSMRRRLNPVEELRKVPPASFALALRLDLLRTGIQAAMARQVAQQWGARCVGSALAAAARRRARAGPVHVVELRAALAPLLTGHAARPLTVRLVGSLWLQLCTVKKMQLAALTLAGDRLPLQEPHERLDRRLGSLDWRLVDLMLLYERTRCCDLIMLNVQEPLRALVTLALLVRALGPPARPALAWARVRSAYLATDRTASVTLLQLRWLQLCTLAEERLRGAESPTIGASAPCDCDGAHASRHDLNHPLIQFIATDSAVCRTFSWSRVLRKDGVQLVTEEDISDLALKIKNDLVSDFTELEAIETVKGLKKYINTKLLGQNENLDKYNDNSYSESDKVKTISEELSRMETESQVTAKKEIEEINEDMNNVEVPNLNTEEDETTDGSSDPLVDVVVKQERDMLEISEERFILPDSVQTYRPYCEFDTSGDYMRGVIFDPSTNSSKASQVGHNSFGHIETQRKGKTVIKREIIEQINIDKLNGDKTKLRNDSSTESEDEFDHRKTVKRKLSEDKFQINGTKMYKTTKSSVDAESKSRGEILKGMDVDDNVVNKQKNIDGINVTEYQYHSDSSTESEDEFRAVKTILKESTLRPELKGLSETFLKNKRNQMLLKLCLPVVLRLRKCEKPKTGRKRERLRFSKIPADRKVHKSMTLWPNNVHSCWCHRSTRPLKEEMDDLDSLMKQIVPKEHAVDTLINAAVLAHKEYWKEPDDKKMVVTAGPGFNNIINIDKFDNRDKVVDSRCEKTVKINNDEPMTRLTEFTAKLSTNENEDFDKILSCNIIARPDKSQLTDGQTQPLSEKPMGPMVEAKLPVIKKVCSLADIIKKRNKNDSIQSSKTADKTRKIPKRNSTSVFKPIRSINENLCSVTASPTRIGAARCKLQASPKERELCPAVGRKGCSQPCSMTDGSNKIDGNVDSSSVSKPSQIDGKESYLPNETNKCDVEDSTVFKLAKNNDVVCILIDRTKKSGDKDSTSVFKPTQSNDDHVCFIEDETNNINEDVCYLDEEPLRSDDVSTPISKPTQDDDKNICIIDGETEKSDDEVACFVAEETEKSDDVAKNDDEYVYFLVDEKGDDQYSVKFVKSARCDDEYLFIMENETVKSDGKESLPISKPPKDDDNWETNNFDVQKAHDLNARPDDAGRFCLQVDGKIFSVDTPKLLDPTVVKPSNQRKESTNQPRPVRLTVNQFQGRPRPRILSTSRTNTKLVQRRHNRAFQDEAVKHSRLHIGLPPALQPAPEWPWALSARAATSLAQYAASAPPPAALLRLDLSLPLYTLANYLILTDKFLPCKTASYWTLEQNLRRIELSDDHVCGRECDLESKVYEERLRNNVAVNEDKKSSEESSEIIDLTDPERVKLKVKSFADVGRMEKRSPEVVQRFGRHFMKLPGGSSKYAVIYTVVSSTEQCDQLFRERAKMYVLPHSQGCLFPLNVLEMDSVALFQQYRAQTVSPQTPELAPDGLTHPNRFDLNRFQTVKHYVNEILDLVHIDMYSETAFIIQHHDALLIEDLTSKILDFKSSSPNNKQLYVVADYKVCHVFL